MVSMCQEYISDVKSECTKAILEVCLATPTSYHGYIIVVGIK